MDIYVLLPKPSLRPPFVKIYSKKLRSRATSASTFPSPSRCLPTFLAKSCRSLTSARRNRKCKRRNFSRVNILLVLVYTANSVMPSIVRFFRFFPFFPFPSLKIVGRQTRVIGQGSKTWKGYRNSLLPPFLLSFFIVRSHLISIFFFVFVSHSLSLSFPLSPLSLITLRK